MRTSLGNGRMTRRTLLMTALMGTPAALIADPLVSALLPTRRYAIAQETGGDVPMFRGNAARTGEMPGPGPDPTHGVQERWRFATGGAVYSSPAVVDGVVYVGSNDGSLYALDVATGAEQWRFAGAKDRWFASSPAVVDGVVYIGSNDSNLYVLDAATGIEQWRFAGVSSDSPAVVDGVVYVAAGNSVYALDAATGIERWRFATEVDATISSSAVVNSVVYVSGFDNTVYALDAVTGTERWRFVTESINNSSPVAVDGMVYFGSYDGNIYALDGATGSERWRIDASESTIYRSSPAVVDGVVYIGSEDNNVYAFEAAQPMLERDATAEVTEDGVNLRGGPAMTAVVRAELLKGTRVSITGEAVVVSGITWWPVTLSSTGESGWLDGAFLHAVWPE